MLCTWPLAHVVRATATQFLMTLCMHIWWGKSRSHLFPVFSGKIKNLQFMENVSLISTYPRVITLTGALRSCALWSDFSAYLYYSWKLAYKQNPQAERRESDSITGKGSSNTRGKTVKWCQSVFPGAQFTISFCCVSGLGRFTSRSQLKLCSSKVTSNDPLFFPLNCFCQDLVS